ncbi:PREDICTED: Krueppel homolog 1 [Rhagoletis zephyria]|nr:PREDICTED: Krueppel homolog 1 [Rhagoletis zephyria]XP_036320653.1 Krueppel homolog 1 isoform X2 [Rhagoletis pomonella]XP_036320654.1 Krueppel homolog 1 isoform X2 [Rhagoletis pomonella]XP_036320655.1 Krueppel homolog 1 isoform X2 [Rhagoletis pomonella]XP_036320656.1 Krueppel homolog 1 isoform X2 [Rhagoletis pomonella]XP_036320657.1 Krueppel homolog 1 isoform X2 [Rhagoletis pomonella]XP_036320658.1 Krueppel homolog 1 isoform X2 [Rhagoletis pomonella]XP_036320659.1 Krueppel homolog 1 isofor
MVYYQSTPLVIKTEKPSQAQFCTPLQTVTTSETMTNLETAIVTHKQQEHQLQQSTTNVYNQYGNVAITLQEQHESSPLPHTSIIPSNTTQTSTKNLSTNHASNITLHANIKSEPNAGLYGRPISEISTNSESTALAFHSCITVASNAQTAISRKLTVNKPQFKCEQCGMTFGSKSAHTSHTKSHAKSTALVGGVAMQAARLGETTEAGVPTSIPKTPDMAGVAGGDPYQCNVCQKTFAVPARLIRHYRTHTGERPFECEFCHKLFSVKENLQVHRRIHTKERPYKCDVCERAFEHSGKLHRHMRIHTGERPHKCSVCEKTFIQSGQLVIHMRTHTGEKPYKCPVEGCGKGFTCSKQLKVHSRTHTGEKPYHCDICFRDFGYNHVLKLHRVQHYGSKCYKCTICDETFKSKKEMEAHIKGHAKEFPDDDDDAGAVAGSAPTSKNGHIGNSTSSSSCGEAISAPGSPMSPATSTAAIAKRRIIKEQRIGAPSLRTTSSILPNPASPSSPQSTLSSGSSIASASRLSTGSPESLPTSPPIAHALEIDHHSRDSGVVSASNNRQLSLSLSAVNSNEYNAQQSVTFIIEELPTDLSKQHIQQQLHHSAATILYQGNQIQNSLNYPTTAAPSTYSYHQLQHRRTDLDGSVMEPPTINPALLEAASIVRQLDMLDSHREEETGNAAVALNQLQSSKNQQQQQKHLEYQNRQELNSSEYEIQRSSNTPTTSYASQRLSLSHDLSQYDDTLEANELIEHYKRGELARHGLHKGYAPVPKFEPSPLNNEIVRQVEAAIAPLRSSTESPERSSSPESDSMMMADRDVMTLPLRKRKLYMHEGSPIAAAAVNVSTRDIDNALSHIAPTSGNSESNHALSATVSANHENGAKVMRMSSVIQFAKAS